MSQERFGSAADAWFAQAAMSETTKRQRRRVYERDIEPSFANRILTDIDARETRAFFEQLKSRRGAATAIHALEIMRNAFCAARSNGFGGEDPVAQITTSSLGVFRPRDRWLSQREIGILTKLLEQTTIRREYRLAVKLILLTLTRRSELVLSRWSEIDFEQGVWTIPPGRAKSTKPRYVYLSRQAFDILVELNMRAGASEFVLPSVLDPFTSIAPICLNRTTTSIFEEARARKLPLGRFSLYDLLRTASTNLRNAGFEDRWIELALGRDVMERKRGVFDRAKHAGELRHMLQEWAHMVDAWAAGAAYTPNVIPAQECGLQRCLERTAPA